MKENDLYRIVFFGVSSFTVVEGLIFYVKETLQVRICFPVLPNPQKIQNNEFNIEARIYLMQCLASNFFPSLCN